MTNRTLSVWLVLMAAAPSLIAQGCSAESVALKLVQSQGLNLLRPARTYITPGGMFVKGKGTPVYVDSYEEVSPESGNLIDFDAVMLEEASGKTFGIGFAFELGAKLLAKPLGLQAKQNTDVKLAQVESKGQRLRTTAVDDLLKAGKKTAAAALAEIKQKNQVYLVQEVYRTSDFSLEAAAEQGLSVTYGGGKPVADCAAGGGDAKPKDAGNAKADAKAAPDTGKGDQAVKDAAKGVTESAKDAVKPTTPAAKETPASTPAATPAAGVAFCREGQYTLKLHTPSPLPFAVRLVKLHVRDGVLQRDTAATMKITLGTAEVAAAPLNDSWEITNIERRGTK